VAKNTGTLVIAPIRPYDSADTYPSAHANEIKGGHHQVLTIVERDAIPAARRLEGMFCFVKETGKDYRLEADLETWAEVIGQGSAESCIVSNPGSGEYKVVNIRIGADKKIIITYEDTPQL